MSPIEIMIRDAADVAASLDLISRPPKKARPRRATPQDALSRELGRLFSY